MPFKRMKEAIERGYIENKYDKYDKISNIVDFSNKVPKS
jgi:hypothetical protein